MQDYDGLVVHMENKGIREIARSDGMVLMKRRRAKFGTISCCTPSRWV